MRAVLAAASGLLIAFALLGEAPQRGMFTAPAGQVQTVTYVPVSAAPAGYSVNAYGQTVLPAQRIAYRASEQEPEWLYAAAGAAVGAAAALYASGTGKRASALRMEAEPEKPLEAAEEAPAEAPAPAPEEPKEQPFDITNYSMTITIAVIFIIVKSLSALGIPIGPQGR